MMERGQRAARIPISPETPAVEPARRRGHLAVSVGLMLLAVLLLAVLGYVPRWRQRAEVRAETLELAIPTVAVVSPAPAPAKGAAGAPLPAEINPFVEASIHARASGYLKRWLVDIGAQVEQGQLLAEIETPELDRELERNHAELAQAGAALELARSTAARFSELVKSASVSEQENAEKQADLALKSATVAAARANVRRVEQMSRFGRVTAPFSGTITSRGTDVGALIAAGSEKELFRLADTRRLRVQVRVPQSMSRSILPGYPGELMIPELPGQMFPAKVLRTAGVLSAESRTLLVELEVDNARGQILAGGFGQVHFPEARVELALTLPSNAVLFRAEGPQIGIVQADGKIELRGVKLGRDLGQVVEIVAGAGPADRVVLNPSDALVSGTAVRISGSASAEESR